MTMERLMKAAIDSETNGNPYAVKSKCSGATYLLLGFASARNSLRPTYPIIKLGIIQKSFGQPTISDTFAVDAETTVQEYEFTEG